MWRLVAAFVLALTTLGWPAATDDASTATLQAVERLEGDFDGDGFIDLAISVPFEDVATARDAGAVGVLYGSAGGLTATGSQGFWQGTGGAAGTAEAGDLLGSGFVGGDPSAGSSTAGIVHGRRRANASGLTGDRSSRS